MNKLIKWILPIVFVFLAAGCGEKAVVNKQLAEKVSEKPDNLLRLDDFKQVMQEEATLLSSKGEGTHEMFILSAHFRSKPPSRRLISAESLSS